MKTIIDVKNKGHKVIVFGAIASTIREDNDPIQWSEFPVSGTCFERNKIAKEFDLYLRSECEKNNIKFFSILDFLIDENGLTKEEYYSMKDKIHLSVNAKSLVEPLLEKCLQN